MALASAVCDSAIGFRNSSSRISPGCGFGRRSVVVDDFDFMRIVVSPDKTNPPLFVDADRMLSSPILLQRFQTVAGRHTQIVEPLRVADQTQLSQGDRLNVGRKPPAAPASPYRRGLI